MIRVLDKPAESNPDWNGDVPDSGTSYAPWRVYNIGNNNPIELNDYISELEKGLGKEAIKEMLPLQPGDVPDTYADIKELIQDIMDKELKEDINENRTDLLIKLMIEAAIYEFMYMHKTPVKVVISEYLKASDFFVDASQKKFLNALLDKISKLSRDMNV